MAHGPRGRIYLDARWEEHGLVVEIDGVQHREGLQVSVNHLSRNEVTLGRDRVLRIDLIGLRLRREEFLDQVARALADPVRGDSSPPAASRYLEPPDQVASALVRGDTSPSGAS